MFKFKKKTKSLMKVVDVAALLLVVQTVNSACMWLFHQPEIPDSALKYKKIKNIND